MLERLLVAAVLALGAVACSLPVPRHAELERPASAPRDAFIVLGDTQRSLTAEQHLLGREQNDAERVALVDQIAGKESPAFIVHLGDLVAKASPPHWHYFDQLMAPLNAARIPLFPVLGNHEYFGDGRDPSRSARLRYPDLAHGGFYAKRWHRLGLVWLDTNLTGRAAARQAEWLTRTLRTLDDMPGVDATVLFTHHPPFTNGVAREGHPGVRDELLPRIRRSRKAVALFSAHVHGYERFERDELALFVSGGGGGPRVEYRAACASCPAPATPALDRAARRPLNYLVVRDTGAGLTVTTRCLDGSPACPASGVLDVAHLPAPAARHRESAGR